MNDFLKTIAPAIATVIGGPLAGAAVSFLADKLGISEPTQEKIQNVLQGFTAADTIRLKELDIEFQKFCMQNGIQLQLAQVAVNQEEAKSSSMFIAGGRPFILWTCGIAFAYAALLEPFGRFAAVVFFNYTGNFPVIDTNLTMQVLLGLLGLGALRTYEKAKGAEGNR